MDNILDLRKIIGILRKHWTLIVLTMIGFAVVAFGIAEFVITPKYTSTTEILVNQKKDDNGNTGAAYENQQADVQMISTYKDIITNEVILKQVKNELKNPTKVIKPAQKATYKTLADGTKKLTKASSPAVVKANGEKYDVTVPELKNDITITSEQNSQVFSPCL